MEKSQLSVVVILTGVESEPEVSGVVLLQAQRPSAITPAIISAASDFSFINQTVLSFFVYITPQGAYIPISNQVGSAQKLFGIGVLKYLQIPIPLTAFDQFPVLHHMNFVRKIKRRVNLMGNEKITALFFLLNSF